MVTPSRLGALRRPRARRAGAAVLSALGACGFGAAEPAEPAGPPPEVVLVGDSLVQEAAPFLHDALDAQGVIDLHFGGTAPCDWLDDDLPATPDRVVVLSFAGNSLTPCMADEEGVQRRGQALLDQYRADLTALVAEARRGGATVILVGQPDRGPALSADPTVDLEVAGINAVSAALAAQEGVSYVDAGAAVEDADGDFTLALPCLPDEAECGPDGTNVVRNDDGVHLCPGRTAAPCPVYSSGAFRFARAIIDAIDPPR